MSLAKKPKTQRLNPWWRGVGCLMFVALTWGAYLLGGVLLDVYTHWPSAPKRVPDNLGITVGPIELPVGLAQADPALAGKARKGVVVVGPLEIKVGSFSFYLSFLQVAMVAVVDVVLYALIVIVYSRFSPYKPGPTDAPPVYPKKRGGKNMTR